MAGRLPEDVRKAAVARVAAGESPYAVAEDVGVSFGVVYGWMDKAGVVGPRVAAREDRQEKVSVAAGLVQQGMPLAQAARSVGLATALSLIHI